MATQLEITNAALALIAEDAIDATVADTEGAFIAGALDPTDEVQAAVAAVYTPVKTSLLNAHPWSWLAVNDGLQAASPHRRSSGAPGTESWRYEYRWHKPMREIGNTRAVYDRADGDPKARGWDVVGAFVFTEFSPAWMTYQRDVGEEVYPQLFVTALELRLASALAYPLKEDVETVQLYRQMAREALADAQRVDSQGHPSESIPYDEFSFVVAHDAGGFGLQGRSLP